MMDLYFQQDKKVIYLAKHLDSLILQRFIYKYD